MAYVEKRAGRKPVFIGEVELPPIMGKRSKLRERFETWDAAVAWEARVKLLKHLSEDERRQGLARLKGDPAPPKGPTFAELAQACKDAGGPTRGKWKRGRDKSIFQRLETLLGMIGATPVADINTELLDTLVDKLARKPGRGGKGKMTPATINRYLTAISAVLTFACQRRKLGALPYIPYLEEDGKRLLWLTEAAEDAVCAHMTARGWLASALTTRVLAATGLRWSELESLEPGQVEDAPEHAWVRLWETKTDTPRSVPISLPLARDLRAMVGSGTVPKYITFNHHLKSAVKSAGEDSRMSVHTLRHTCASRLALGGEPAQNIMKWLGHKRITTTMRYMHLNDGVLTQMQKKVSPRAGEVAAEVVSLADHTQPLSA